MFSFSASDAKVQFGEMMAKAQREPVAITKNGRPSVVVISAEEYDKLEMIKLQNLKALITRSVAQAERGDLHGIDDVFSDLSVDELAAAGDKTQG